MHFGISKKTYGQIELYYGFNLSTTAPLVIIAQDAGSVLNMFIETYLETKTIYCCVLICRTEYSGLTVETTYETIILSLFFGDRVFWGDFYEFSQGKASMGAA